MKYPVNLKPRAVKDLKRLPKREAMRVANSLAQLSEGLSGDVKKLTNFTPEYRLRVGTYCVLFDVEDGNRVIVFRVLHRTEAYRNR